MTQSDPPRSFLKVCRSTESVDRSIYRSVISIPSIELEDDDNIQESINTNSKEIGFLRNDVIYEG